MLGRHLSSWGRINNITGENGSNMRYLWYYRLGKIKMEVKNMKKFFKIGCLGFIGLLVLLIVIAIATGGGEETPETTTTPTTTPTTEDTDSGETETPAEEPAEEADVAGIGQELQVGDVYFTANGVSNATNVGGEYGVNAQSQFTIVNVTIRNEKNEAITVDSSFFKLLSGERTYDSDGTAGIYANENASFFLESINPGVSLTGNVIFDVPADLENIQLQVQTGFFGTETGVINLQ